MPPGSILPVSPASSGPPKVVPWVGMIALLPFGVNRREEGTAREVRRGSLDTVLRGGTPGRPPGGRRGPRAAQSRICNEQDSRAPLIKRIHAELAGGRPLFGPLVPGPPLRRRGAEAL